MTVTQIRARDLTVGAVVSLPRYSERLTVTGIRYTVAIPPEGPNLLVDFAEPRRLNGPFLVDAPLVLRPDETVIVITDKAPEVSDADRIEAAVKRIDRFVANLDSNREEAKQRRARLVEQGRSSDKTDGRITAYTARIDDLQAVRAFLDGTEDRYIASLKTPKGA